MSHYRVCWQRQIPVRVKGGNDWDVPISSHVTSRRHFNVDDVFCLSLIFDILKSPVACKQKSSKMQRSAHRPEAPSVIDAFGRFKVVLKATEKNN